MKQELLHHRVAYLILTVGLISLTFLFLGSWPNRFLQRLIILAMMVFYTAWGTLSHLKADQLSQRIWSEYVGISVLAGVILLLITL